MGHELEQERFRAWAEFHAANPQFYAQFKQFTFQAIEAGQKIGARLIGERIRWEHLVVMRRVDAFKLNNNHLPYYSRLFMEDFPQHAGFFEIRERRS